MSARAVGRGGRRDLRERSGAVWRLPVGAADAYSKVRAVWATVM